MSRVTETLFLLGTATLTINQFRPSGINQSLPNLFYILSGISLITEWPLKLKKPAIEWIPFHPFWVPSMLILMGGLISSIYAVNPDSSITVTVKEWFVFSIWMSVGVRMVLKGHSRKLTDLLIAGSLFTSVVAILDFSIGTNIGKYFVSSFSEVNFLAMSRYGGTNGHPNEQAMFLAVVYPLIVERIFIGHGNRKRRTLLSLLFSIALLTNVTAVFITGSVTGYLGILVSTIIFFAATFLRYPKLMLSFPLLASIALAVLTPDVARHFYPDLYIKLTQRDTFYRVMEFTGPSRLMLMNEGIEMITRSPFIGAGMDQSGTGGLDDSSLVTSYYVHNTIIQAWLAGGVLAFLGVAIIYWKSLELSALTILDYLRGFCSTYQLALAVSIISFVLMDMAQPNIYQRFKWLIAAILIGNRLIQKATARGRIRSEEQLTGQYCF